MKFKVGETVRFTARFLKSVGWHTDVPDNGTVTELLADRVAVDWHDGFGPTLAHEDNLILASKSHLEPL